MPLVMVREYSNRIEADVARLGLEAEGILAVLFDAGVSSLGLGPITAARLMIEEEDLARAQEILSATEN